MAAMKNSLKVKDEYIESLKRLVEIKNEQIAWRDKLISKYKKFFEEVGNQINKEAK